MEFSLSRVVEIEPGPLLLADQRSDGGGGARVQSVVLDRKARAHLRLVPGEWHLSLQSLGQPVPLGLVTIAAGANRYECDVLTRPGLVGRVLDERGRPLEGAVVEVGLTGLAESPAGASRGALLRHATPSRTTNLVLRTDARGEYLVPCLPVDQFYTVRASMPGHARASLRALSLEPGQPTRVVDLVLEAARIVTGEVVDSAGLPVAGCRVRLQVGSHHEATSSDGDGLFSFAAVPPGQGVAWTVDGDSVNNSAALPAGGDAQLVLTLADGAHVRGSLTYEDGSPAVRLTLIAQAVGLDEHGVSQGSLASRMATTDGEGRFDLGPFPVGRVRLSEPMRTFYQAEVVAPGEVHLVLPSPRTWDVLLAFRDARTDAALAGDGELDLRWGDEALHAGHPKLEVALDAQGQWTFQRTTPGGAPVRLTFRFAGYEPAVVDESLLTQSGQDEPSVVRLRAAEPPVIVEVVGSAGPVEGASVWLVWPLFAHDAHVAGVAGEALEATASPFPGQAAVEVQSRTDRSGLASFQRLQTGPVQWRVAAPGLLPATGTLALRPSIAGAADLTVELLPASGG